MRYIFPVRFLYLVSNSTYGTDLDAAPHGCFFSNQFLFTVSSRAGVPRQKNFFLLSFFFLIFFNFSILNFFNFLKSSPKSSPALQYTNGLRVRRSLNWIKRTVTFACAEVEATMSIKPISKNSPKFSKIPDYTR